ncbi:hypothetical protein F4777DRAFT_102303 [Nemania sp. FL0916]|nr:hypothetical protein F4777DRAFT_102303 [Nemania sp. FL0916]
MASMEVQRGPTTRSMVDAAAAANAHYHHRYDHDLHHRQYLPQQATIQQNGYNGCPSLGPKSRKRKADSQENERLSKRLSLLNLEKHGHKLYIPVESTSPPPVPEHAEYNNPSQPSSSSAAATDDDFMQLDNTKHKVYIYDLDAELSSADENSESESLPGSPTSGRDRLIFSPEIKRHLYRSRIPSAVLANPDGQLAGHSINDMQMVLYSEPSSLTVPREQDPVRKAILEARARARQQQQQKDISTSRTVPELQQQDTTISAIPSTASSFPSFGNTNGAHTAMNGFSGHGAVHPTPDTASWHNSLAVEDDVDAMDMD